MRYVEAIEAIRTGHFKPVYVLHGSQAELKEEIIQELKRLLVKPEWEAMVFRRLEGTGGLREALQIIETPSFFGRRLLVVSGIKVSDLSEKKNEILRLAGSDTTSHGLSNDASSTGCLVMDIDDETGKASTAVNALGRTDCMVDCGNLRYQELKKWLKWKTDRLGKTLDPDAERVILQATHVDMGLLSRDMEKAAAYSGNRQTITKQDLMEAGTAFSALRVFDLLDAIESDGVSRPIRTLREVIHGGEPPLKILQLMYSHFSLACEIKSMLETGASAAIVKSRYKRYSQFFVENAMSRAGKHTRTELENALLNLAKADMDIKQGKIRPDVALELALIGLFQTPRASTIWHG